MLYRALNNVFPHTITVAKAKRGNVEIQIHCICRKNLRFGYITLMKVFFSLSVTSLSVFRLTFFKVVTQISFKMLAKNLMAIL